jgi:acyl dehydratase
MAIDPARLKAYAFPEIAHDYVERDAILYALGLGLGDDPTASGDLDHLLETRLKVLPTMAVTLSSPGMWVRDPALGIDWVRLVHSAQEAEFLAPLPPRGKVIGSARIADLFDRGADRGAVIVVERKIRDAESGLLYCVLRQTLLARGDGGFGGEPPPAEPGAAPPARGPDSSVRLPVSRRAALIYRLSGDWNPLHADPEVARAAGFPRPILHGLASYGMAGVAICRALGEPMENLRALSLRFANVVYPGDPLEFAIWRDNDNVTFEARVENKIVLNRGRALLGG